MPKRLAGNRAPCPWLDVLSYGRRSPSQTPRFTAEQIDEIARTVRGVPEVVLKASGGGRTVRNVEAHIGYIGREGDLAIETDDGFSLRGRGVEKFLTDDWDLDLETAVARRWVDGKSGPKPSKLVCNLVFSSAVGTPPQKVLAAARKFAQEKFALQRRYAMVLHTDRPHPHVHMLVNAMSVDGVRLHITSALLRQWRHDFARCLRELGIAANASGRMARGEMGSRQKQGIYRAAWWGESTYMRKRVEGVAAELLRGGLVVEKGKARLMETRKAVERGWMVIADALDHQGQRALAADVRRFAGKMPAPMTEKEEIAQQLMQHLRARRLEREGRAR